MSEMGICYLGICNEKYKQVKNDNKFADCVHNLTFSG